jgi:hypothetical protein
MNWQVQPYQVDSGLTEAIKAVSKELRRESNRNLPSVGQIMTRRQKREQAARVKRFLALPVSLQEGALQYAEKIRESYRE